MLPQMNEKFAAFIAPARQTSGGLLLCGAIGFLFLIYIELTFAIIGMAAAFVSITENLDVLTAYALVGADITNPDSPHAIVILLTTFIGMFVAVWATSVLFRDLPLRSLIGPNAPFRYFLTTCVITTPLVLGAFVYTLYIGDVTPNLALNQWAMWMALALPLLLIQVSAEEILFRGYLMQELATRFSSRWIWYTVPAVVFGLLHLDPERFGSNAILVVVGTTMFGFFAADLTVRTGNLGAAIGLHFMNNFMAMMLVSLDGTLNGLSLFVTNTHASDQAAVRGLLIADIVTIAGLYALYLLFIRWRKWG